jgi:hypothetical protein
MVFAQERQLSFGAGKCTAVSRAMKVRLARWHDAACRGIILGLK